MKRIIIGFIFGILVACVISLFAACLYSNSDLKIEQINYASTNDGVNVEINSSVFKLNHQKLPTIIIK